MYFGVITMLIIVGVLSAASLQGVLKFRKLTKSIRERSVELPKAAELGQRVSDLRSKLWDNRDRQIRPLIGINSSFEPTINRNVSLEGLKSKIQAVEHALANYEIQVQNSQTRDPRLRDNDAELEFVAKFKMHLAAVYCIVDDRALIGPAINIDALEEEMSQLQDLATEIPVFMNKRMELFADRARTEYHTWMTVSIVSAIAAFSMIAFLTLRFLSRIIQPLELLVEGSRQVAGGNHDYRIELNSEDEVAELAEALNAMTSSFQEIQSDLNRQVQERTKEVVRSEKMASVGFLAAGVAHEINNPLATIAWSAESLETRIHDILNPLPGAAPDLVESEIDDMKKYLRRIQDEAFRCKGITSGLLDFSRMGDVKKVPTNLVEIVDGVVDMVRPLSKYRGRNILFSADSSFISIVNEQEMKQVALNLITNALGSVEEGGTVEIDLRHNQGHAELRVRDDGCGLTDEVKKHLFEPFFTRRRDGQGTGLGLAITYQIIEEHGGRIVAESDGPGHGATFTVSLPLVTHEQKQLQAAA